MSILIIFIFLFYILWKKKLKSIIRFISNSGQYSYVNNDKINDNLNNSNDNNDFNSYSNDNSDSNSNTNNNDNNINSNSN